jgi:lysyl-tRNA synthetase class 2
MTDRLTALRDRAAMLARARAFFAEREILEVDCPQITAAASVDAHIDLIPTFHGQQPQRYLHSSPEYGMKRLLGEGIGDIYQLAHVFRQGEYGQRHNPEFTMAEWYRLGFSFEEMMAETVEFIELFVGKLEVRIWSYRELFLHHVAIDYLNTSVAQLEGILCNAGQTPYTGAAAEGKEALLNLILGSIIEPQLGRYGLDLLAYYPASQAALAQTRFHGDEPVAERFEIYYRGIELANGYHELTDVTEQRKRLAASNSERIALGKEPLPIDEHFLAALQKGLPDCSGVAVGFDRLMMLRQGASKLADVLPFDWSRA